MTPGAPLRQARVALSRGPVALAVTFVVLVCFLATGVGAGVPPATGPARGEPTVAAAGGTPVKLQAGVVGRIHEISSGGLARHYLVVGPAGGPTNGLALIVVLHGSHVGPHLEEVRTDFWPLVREGKALLVLPAGYGKSWDAGQGCCGPANLKGTRDVAFVDKVVHTVERRYRTDPARAYLVGYSNGGKMAQRIACAGPDPFAAVATYGGVPLVACAHGPPESVLLADATADPLVPYSGPGAWHNQALLPSITTSTALWALRDGCTGNGTARRLAHGAVTVTTWSGCRSGDRVTLVSYRGGSHFWPGSTASAHVPFAAVSPVPVQSLMWDFFSGLPGRRR